MCRFKDTSLQIKKLDFNEKRVMMAVYIIDGREVFMPIGLFPKIKRVQKSQREYYMIMNGQSFTFDVISKHTL